jgi:hypothetical protein
MSYLWADVRGAGEGRDGDGVSVQDGKVVAVPAVDDAHPAVPRRQPTGEDGDKGGGDHHLQIHIVSIFFLKIH